MVESESISGPINEEPLVHTEIAAPTTVVAEPTITPPVSEKMGAGETVSSFVGSLKKSLCLKIFSGVVVLIFILMIVFIVLGSRETKTSSDCEGKLKIMNNNLKSCNSQTNTLRNEVSQLKEQNSRIGRQITEKESEHKTLKDKNDELVKKQGEIESEITKITKDNSDLESKISALKTDIDHIKEQIRQYETEIENFNKDIPIKTAELSTLKTHQTIYFVGLGVSAVGHILLISDAVKTGNLLDTEQSRAEHYKTENAQLNKTIEAYIKQYDELKKKKIVVEKNLTEYRKKLSACEAERVEIEIHRDDCSDRMEIISHDLRSLPAIGAIQGHLQLMKEISGNETHISELYNSDSLDRYSFVNGMRRGSNGLNFVIMNTTRNHFFGGGLNSTWPSDGEQRRDSGAFTFSTMHGRNCRIFSDKIVAYDADTRHFAKFGSNEIDISHYNATSANGTAIVSGDFYCGSLGDEKETFYEIGTTVILRRVWGYHVSLSKLTT